MLKRLAGFLFLRMGTAEDFDGYPDVATPPAVARAVANNDEDLAIYLAGLAKESRDRTDKVLAGIQAKASSFLTLIVGLVPLALAAVSLSAPSADATALRWAGFAMLVAATFTLIIAAISAAMASGFGKTATIRLAFLEKQGQAKSKVELVGAEANAWDYAAVANMENARRRAYDLFRARSLTIWALTLALIGLIAVLASVGGNISALLGAPSAVYLPGESSALVPM